MRTVLEPTSSAFVLVVDDDNKLADVMVRGLERGGYECTVAGSGDQALWAVLGRRPDVIVLDVMIPHPSGIEVCRHLRQIGWDGFIVVVSARSNSGDVEAATRAGADRFLPKPFAMADLVATVDALVGR
jgi:DNA-binding response OmpR family regulator